MKLNTQFESLGYFFLKNRTRFPTSVVLRIQNNLILLKYERKERQPELDNHLDSPHPCAEHTSTEPDQPGV